MGDREGAAYFISSSGSGTLAASIGVQPHARFDSGFYNRNVVEFCWNQGIGFTISAKQSPALVERTV